MLRVNVGLGRKVSRDYQSTGYSVNLDGEISSPLDNPKAILESIHQLYRLAEDALAREIDRDQGDQAIGRRDETPPAQSNGPRSGGDGAAAPDRVPAPNRSDANRSQGRQEDAATNKQVQYLLSIGKRLGLSKGQLEARIEEITGNRVTV